MKKENQIALFVSTTIIFAGATAFYATEYYTTRSKIRNLIKAGNTNLDDYKKALPKGWTTIS